MRPSFSTRAMPGRTSSAIAPPETFTASGTRSPPSASRTDRATDDAGLLLGLLGRGAEVRRHDDRLELEERRLGGRLLGEDVETGAGHPTVADRVGQGQLVDDAAARRVDDPHGRLDLLERLLADEADGLGRLGQVHGDEVRLGEQLVEPDEAGTELAGLGRGRVRVVGEQRHAEPLEPLGHERADPAQADDADRLVEQLDAAVLAALPRTALEGRAGRRDVAGAWPGAARWPARRPR